MSESFDEYVKEYVDATLSKFPKRFQDEVIKILYGKAFALLMNFKRNNNCESPIEELLYLRLIDSLDYIESLYREIDSSATIKKLTTQENIKTLKGKILRVDIYIEVSVQDKVYKFAIECDGHDFHEKTKAQAARDKYRDRLLQSMKINVIHFTGSEIWKSPSKCTKEVWDIIAEQTGLNEVIQKEIESWGPLDDLL